MRYNILLLLFILFYSSLRAQPVHYNIQHYTTDNGLPQNSINEIHFDRRGYCWLGTEMGLVRFDGARFKVFGAEQIHGLRSERIRMIGEDKWGNTYAGLNNRQLLVIKPPGRAYAARPALWEGGNMWLSSRNNFVVAVSAQSKVADSLLSSMKYGGQEQLELATRSGSFYIIVKNKTYCVEKDRLEVIDSVAQPYYKNHAIVNDRLLMLGPDRKIKSWLGAVSQKHASFISGPLGKDPFYLKGRYSLMSSVSGAYIYAGQTLYQLLLEDGHFTSKVLLRGITIENLFVVYYNEKQGKYYLGSLTSGLYIISPSPFYYPPIEKQAIQEGFRSQAVVEQGRSIICERYLYRESGPVTLPVDNRLGATACTDDNDNVYYGTTADLFKFSLKTRQNRKLTELDSRPSAIIRDKTDPACMVLCTSLSVGKIYNDTLKMLQRVPGRVVGKAIWGMTQIGRDTFLLSTQDGLKWYDFNTNRIFRSILDSLTIHGVYYEANQRVWISTYGKGFFLYDRGKITNLPSGPSHAMKAVHAFVDDGKGNFWLPTNSGLYQVRKDNLLAYAAGKAGDVYYYAFSTKDGLRSNEFNGGSIPGFVWLRDSMLSLLTIQGPVWFYPGRVKTLLPDNPIYFERLSVSGKDITGLKDQRITLPPDFEQLALVVSSPYFGNRENMILNYRVEGWSEGWKAVSPDGEITIGGLQSGKYRLVVRKVSGDAPGRFITTCLDITVTPYFYNTWYFYLGLLLLTAALVYLFLKMRTRMLTDRNRKLAGLVEMRTRDLEESNQTKDEIITMVLHDIRSPLRFIHLISQYLAGERNKLDENELEQKLKELKNSTASLNNFTEQFFTWAISHHKNFTITRSWFDLQDIFNETEALYKELIEANGNKLVIEPGNYPCFSDRQLLTVIIRNLLDNANKHTRNGVITLSATLRQETLAISISDTGIGFSPEALQSFLAKKGFGGSQHGHGSIIIQSLVRLIEGRLEASSEQQKGTVFTIALHCPQ